MEETKKPEEKKTPPAKQAPKKLNPLYREIFLMVFMMFSFFLTLCVYLDGFGGEAGQVLKEMLLGMFGLGAMILPVVMLYFSYGVLLKKRKLQKAKTAWAACAFLCLISLMHVFTRDGGQAAFMVSGGGAHDYFLNGGVHNGGAVGGAFGDIPYDSLGKAGAVLALLTGLAISGILMSGRSLLATVQSGYANLHAVVAAIASSAYYEEAEAAPAAKAASGAKHLHVKKKRPHLAKLVPMPPQAAAPRQIAAPPKAADAPQEAPRQLILRNMGRKKKPVAPPDDGMILLAFEDFQRKRPLRARKETASRNVEIGEIPVHGLVDEHAGGIDAPVAAKHEPESKAEAQIHNFPAKPKPRHAPPAEIGVADGGGDKPADWIEALLEEQAREKTRGGEASGPRVIGRVLDGDAEMGEVYEFARPGAGAGVPVFAEHAPEGGVFAGPGPEGGVFAGSGLEDGVFEGSDPEEDDIFAGPVPAGRVFAGPEPEEPVFAGPGERVLGRREGVVLSASQPLRSMSIPEGMDDAELYKDFRLPPIDLLNRAPVMAATESRAQILDNSRKLEETLRSFKVEAKVIEVSVGPTVTRYELAPGQGVKVSQIANLSNDLALSLAAHGIRIEAPIPGKSAVGIEIPNKDMQPVYLREIIEDETFKRYASKMAFAVGKDIAGNTVVADVAKMPHLLIAGATGSGKSVCINTLITSILYKAKPNEVKLLMIDPKVVELSVYNGVPHLLAPVVTDYKKASATLNWAVAEMDIRYNLFAEANVRDLKSYNAVKALRGDTDVLPQVVIIIDELADLMMVAKGEIEELVCRLAQKARAAGIHLIIATQRPSVDVITGLIKANIPSRLAFSVSSGTDSRTVLDMTGAEKLLGKGDMLFLPVGLNKPVRIQCGFISDGEVENVVEFLKGQNPVQADPEMAERVTDVTRISENNGADEFFNEAVEFLIMKGKGSASMLQRQFRIGYNRASRLIEELEGQGIVGPEDGSKPRKVLITMEQWRNGQ